MRASRPEHADLRRRPGPTRRSTHLLPPPEQPMALPGRAAGFARQRAASRTAATSAPAAPAAAAAAPGGAIRPARLGRRSRPSRHGKPTARPASGAASRTATGPTPARTAGGLRLPLGAVRAPAWRAPMDRLSGPTRTCSGHLTTVAVPRRPRRQGRLLPHSNPADRGCGNRRRFAASCGSASGVHHRPLSRRPWSKRRGAPNLPALNLPSIIAGPVSAIHLYPSRRRRCVLPAPAEITPRWRSRRPVIEKIVLLTPPTEKRPLAAIFGSRRRRVRRGRAPLFRRGRYRRVSSCSAAIAAPPLRFAGLVEALRGSDRAPAAPVLIDQEGGRVRGWGRRTGAATRAAAPSLAPPRRSVAARERPPRRPADRPRSGRRSASTSTAPRCWTCRARPPTTVIGDRAYGETPDRGGQRSAAPAEGLIAGGVLPVIKHIPGHGRAPPPTATNLPVVGASP